MRMSSIDPISPLPKSCSVGAPQSNWTRVCDTQSRISRRFCASMARAPLATRNFSAPPPDDQTNGRGIEASSVSLFLLALEPEPGLQNDIRSDFEPLQRDDEFERSERGSEPASNLFCVMSIYSPF